MNFYQELSPIYGDMINFRERLKKEKKIYQNILEKFPAKYALDAGCGSGFHTIILSQLKLKVTGLNNSDHMLNLAREYFTELYPMQSVEGLSCLRKAGFKKLDLYSDLKLSSYQRFQSDNICVFCQ